MSTQMSAGNPILGTQRSFWRKWRKMIEHMPKPTESTHTHTAKSKILENLSVSWGTESILRSHTRMFTNYDVFLLYIFDLNTCYYKTLCAFLFFHDFFASFFFFAFSQKDSNQVAFSTILMKSMFFLKLFCVFCIFKQWFPWTAALFQRCWWNTYCVFFIFFTLCALCIMNVSKPVNTNFNNKVNKIILDVNDNVNNNVNISAPDNVNEHANNKCQCKQL